MEIIFAPPRHNVPVILLSLLILACSTSAVTVGDSEIRDFLNGYLNEVEAYLGGVPVENRAEIPRKYTGPTKHSQYTWLTYREIARVYVYVKLHAATIKYQETCKPADEEFRQELYDKHSSKSKDEDYIHYHVLTDIETSARKFCNFFVRLVCQHDPSSSTYRCLCPTGMIWEKDRCVSKKGHVCDSEELDEKITFYDFIYDDFGDYFQPKCERNMRCRDDYEPSQCMEDKDNTFIVSPTEMATYLRGIIEKVDLLGSNKESVLLYVMREYVQNSLWHSRLYISMEVHMQKLLKEYDQTCDFKADSKLNEFMKSYNRQENPNFGHTRLDYDDQRFEYQKQVIAAKTNICNRFKFLQCSSTDKKCQCMEGKAFNHATKNCEIGVNRSCDPPDEMKIVQYSRYIGQMVYEHVKLACSQKRTCEAIGETKFCLEKNDLEVLVASEAAFEKKLSLNPGEVCNPDEHALLLKNSHVPRTFQEAKDFIDGVSKNSVEYCKIKEFVTCSKDTGKCTCVPPTVIVPVKDRHGNDAFVCKSVDLEVCGKSTHEQHDQLDKLVLPLQNRLTKVPEDNIFCPDGANCIAYTSMQRLCRCAPDRHTKASRFGAQCEHTVPTHLDHFTSQFAYISPAVQKVFTDLHGSLTALEQKMTLQFGGPCDTVLHRHLANIMTFLDASRRRCRCYSDVAGRFWTCPDTQDYCETSPLEKHYKTLLDQVKGLLAKSPSLCDGNRKVTCIDGTCGCSKDSFYEEAECRLDLGSHCYDLIASSGALTSKCRTGTACSGKDVTSRRCKTTADIDVTGVPSSDYALAYVKGVKKAMQNDIKNLKAKLDYNVNILAEGESCNPGDEEAREKAKKEIGPVLMFSENNSDDINVERQEVRLLEKILLKAAPLKRHFKICTKGLHCSTKTHHCKSGTTGPDDGSGTGTGGSNKPTKPYSAIGLANQDRFSGPLLLVSYLVHYLFNI